MSPDLEKMSPAARAYHAEYGSLPTNREQQDRYSAFRFGFEAGALFGRRSTLSEVKKELDAWSI